MWRCFGKLNFHVKNIVANYNFCRNLLKKHTDLFLHHCKLKARVYPNMVAIYTILILINANLCQHCGIIRFRDERSSRSSPGSVFFGSPIRQYLPRQHLKMGSPSIENMLQIAISSSFSFALLILSSPTVFVCRCSLLDSLSLNASVVIFSLETFIQTNTRAFTDSHEVYAKHELAKTKLLRLFIRRSVTIAIRLDLRL